MQGGNLAGPICRVVSRSNTLITHRPVAAAEGTHFSVNPDGPREPVTNEDYVGALAEFGHGAVATLEAGRAARGTACEMVFEINGTQGEVRWDFERMNECNLHLAGGSAGHDGTTRLFARPGHPFFHRFYPGVGNGMGYEDLKMIEAYQFLNAVSHGESMEADFGAALDVARVHAAFVGEREVGGRGRHMKRGNRGEDDEALGERQLKAMDLRMWVEDAAMNQ